MMRILIQYISVVFVTAFFVIGCTSTITTDEPKEYLLSNHGYEASQIIKKNRASDNDVLKMFVAAAEKSERPSSIADFILSDTSTQISSEKFITWLNAQDTTNNKRKWCGDAAEDGLECGFYAIDYPDLNCDCDIGSY